MHPSSLLTVVDGPSVNARVSLFSISLSLFSLSLSLLTLPPFPHCMTTLLPKFSLHRGGASTRQHRQHVNAGLTVSARGNRDKRAFMVGRRGE